MEIDVRLANIDSAIGNLQKTTDDTNKMIKEFSQGLAEQELACAKYRGEYTNELTIEKNKTENNHNQVEGIGKQLKAMDKLLKGMLVGLILSLLGVVGTLIMNKVI